MENKIKPRIREPCIADDLRKCFRDYDSGHAPGLLSPLIGNVPRSSDILRWMNVLPQTASKWKFLHLADLRPHPIGSQKSAFLNMAANLCSTAMDIVLEELCC